jgi:hypothetical protein
MTTRQIVIGVVTGIALSSQQRPRRTRGRGTALCRPARRSRSRASTARSTRSPGAAARSVCVRRSAPPQQYRRSAHGRARARRRRHDLRRLSRSARTAAERVRAGDGGRMSVQNNDVSVEWEVQVPRGVHLTARTVNGAISRRGACQQRVATTVNGAVEAGHVRRRPRVDRQRPHRRRSSAAATGTTISSSRPPTGASSSTVPATSMRT